MREAVIVFVMLVLGSTLHFCHAQSLNDTIVSVTGVIIPCKITLVNEENIAYQYRPKKKLKSTFKSRKRVRYYSIGDSTIVLRPKRSFSLEARVSDAELIHISSHYETHLNKITFPTGVYMTQGEILAKQPSEDFELEIEKRTSEAIGFMGGNDYKILSSSGEVETHTILQQVWAVVDSSGMYLNCANLNCQNWYVKAVEIDSAIVYKAAMPLAEATAIGTTVGVIGGAIGAAIVSASLANRRYWYRMDLRSGKVELIAKKGVDYR